MTDQGAIVRILADCDHYWRETGVPYPAIREMRMQLEAHLIEVAAAGGATERVIGPSLAEFAEAWASEYRQPSGNSDRWTEVTSGATAKRRGARKELLTYVAGGLALVGGVLAGSRISGGQNVEANETWRWIWTFLAIGMGIAEIFTAGFFLLPFAIGATAAGLLAWLGWSGLLSQWLVFFGVSAISFAYLRRFVKHQDEKDQPRIGANRWVGGVGMVVSDIDADRGVGMVKIEGEQWRATTDGGEVLVAGTKIVVKAVRGARLVVEPV